MKRTGLPAIIARAGGNPNTRIEKLGEHEREVGRSHERINSKGAQGCCRKVGDAFSVIVIMTLIALSALAARAEGFELKGNAGRYNVDVKIDHSPPVRGYHDIDISVKDEASRSVTDARVEVEYFMPSFGGKPPMMDYRITTELTGDRYHGRLNLSMAGEWRVIVKIVRGGKGEMVGFSFIVPH